MKRRFIPPLMFVCQMMTEVPMELVSIEDAARVIYTKDKLVSEVKEIERD